MSITNKLTYFQYPVPLAIAGGLVTAAVMGLLIGSGEMGTIKALLLLVFVAAYVVFLHAHTWKFALLICALSFTYVGWGFKVSVMEMSGTLAVLTVAATCWRKQRIPTPKVMELNCFRVFDLALLAWLLYSGGHALYTVMDPFLPEEFALKNFAKTVAGMTGGWALVYYFIHRPRGVIADENMNWSVLVIGLVGLLANILIRLWGIQHGVQNPEIAAELGDAASIFNGVNLDLLEDSYALRAQAPFVATICAVLVGSNWLRRQTPLFRFATVMAFILSFVAAVVSGGRATIIFVFFVTGVTLWVRKYYRLVLGACAAGLLSIVALNLIPGVLHTVPEVMQRSLQMVIFTEESEFARLSISDSTNWRQDLVGRAFAEWQSDPRIFWFGRGTYKFGNEDIIAQKFNIAEGAMETSLRRGSTHSLVTDLLVVYGLCGLVVFFAMMISLLWFLWRVYRHPGTGEVGKAVALICLIQIGFNFVYDLIGGGMTPLQVIWLLIALVGHLYYLEAKNSVSKESQRERRASRPLRPVLGTAEPAFAIPRTNRLRRQVGAIRRN